MFLRHVREVREREENEDEDPPAKITRLAIGVEGGFDASKEQYEYTVSRPLSRLVFITVGRRFIGQNPFPEHPGKLGPYCINVLTHR